MATTPEKIVEYLRTIETTYTDARVLTELEHRSLVWLLHYGQNVFSQIGMDWVGVNFRQKDTSCLMVVKAHDGDTQRVVFITGRTPTDCAVSFVKQFHRDELKWVKDKFA